MPYPLSHMLQWDAFIAYPQYNKDAAYITVDCESITWIDASNNKTE